MEINKRVPVYENPLTDNLVLLNDTTDWYIKLRKQQFYIFSLVFLKPLGDDHFTFTRHYVTPIIPQL